MLSGQAGALETAWRMGQRAPKTSLLVPGRTAAGAGNGSISQDTGTGPSSFRYTLVGDSPQRGLVHDIVPSNVRLCAGWAG